MFSFVKAADFVRKMYPGVPVKLKWLDGGERYICLIDAGSENPLLDNFMAFRKDSGDVDSLYSPFADPKSNTYPEVTPT